MPWIFHCKICFNHSCSSLCDFPSRFFFILNPWFTDTILSQKWLHLCQKQIEQTPMYSCLIFSVDKSKDYISISEQQQQTGSSCSVASPAPDPPTFSSSDPAVPGSINFLSYTILYFAVLPWIIILFSLLSSWFVWVCICLHYRPLSWSLCLL